DVVGSERPVALLHREARLLRKLAHGLGALHGVLDALETLLGVGGQQNIARHGGLLLGIWSRPLALTLSLVPSRGEGNLLSCRAPANRGGAGLRVPRAACALSHAPAP